MPKNMRHVVNILRPTKAAGSLGETQGNPITVCSNWLCSIKSLNGNEGESARQTGATANFEVEGYGDPQWVNLEECYLMFGDRRLNIEFVDDKNQNGINLRLLCGETK